MIALCDIMGCNSKKGAENEGVSDSMLIELKRVGIESIEELHNDFAAFFTTVYNEELYNDFGFVVKYCTDKFKKKLNEAYKNEYEDEGVDEDEAYATWLFRSDYQDGPSEDNKIIKIVPEGDGWYKYDYNDMGHLGSHRIKVLYHVNGRGQIEYYIDDLE